MDNDGSRERAGPLIDISEENAEADKALKALVEARNQAESLIHATDKSVKEHGDKVDEETREAIATAVTDLKSVVEGEDTEGVKTYDHKQGEIASLEEELDDLQLQNMIFLTLALIFVICTVFLAVVLMRARSKGE